MFFRGKLGRRGNGRKTVLFFKGGCSSLSNGSLRFNFKRFILHTTSGVVGGCISIFF
jgi:hypothetical protein